MDIQTIIAGLRDLAENQMSFYEDDGEHEIFKQDNEVCLEAARLLEEQPNEALTCEECIYKKREGWNYENCIRCKRHWDDRYRRKPEKEDRP